MRYLKLTALAVLTAVILSTSVLAQRGTGPDGAFQSGADYVLGGTWLFVKGLTSLSPTAGIGYSTGAGCAVTQITSRTTGVTCTGVSGAITTDTSSLAVETAAEFTVTDTSVAVGDVVVVSIRSGSNSGNTDVTVSTVAAGSFKLRVSDNNAAAGTAETGALIINFAVIKAVSS